MSDELLDGSDRPAPLVAVAEMRPFGVVADESGVEIMRRSGLSKPVVWRWQERFMHGGIDGLLRDKTRKPGGPPLSAETVQRVQAISSSRSSCARFHICRTTAGTVKGWSRIGSALLSFHPASATCSSRDPGTDCVDAPPEGRRICARAPSGSPAMGGAAIF